MAALAQASLKNIKSGILYSRLENVHIKKSTTNDYFKIVVDAQGYIWQATIKGLFVNDGTRFQKFDLPSQNSEIVAMERIGNYIVGSSFAGEIIRINTLNRKAVLIRGNNTWDAEVDNYHYCISTKDSIYFIRFNGGSSIIFDKKSFFSNQTIYTPRITNINFRLILIEAILEKYGIRNSLANKELIAKIFQFPGFISLSDSCFGIGNTIYPKSANNIYKVFNETNRPSKCDIISSFLLNGKELWISWQNGTLQSFPSTDNNIDQVLKGTHVVSMDMDMQDGTLMSTENDGLYLFPKQEAYERYYPLDEPKKFFSRNVQYIGFQNGAMYIGYNKSVVDIIQNDGNMTRFYADTSTSARPVKIFYSTQNGHYYLISYNVYSFNNKLSNAKPTIIQKQLIKDAYAVASSVYIKQKFYNYYSIALNDKNKVIDANTSISSNTFCPAHKDGHYYFGSTRGLYLDSQKVNGVLEGMHILMLRNFGGRIFIGTTKGLWTISSAKDSLNPKYINIHGNSNCQQLNWDGGRYYYVLTDNTLVEIDSSTLSTKTIYTNSILMNEMSINCFALHDGKVYIGTTKGIVVLDPRAMQNSKKKIPPIYITNVDSSSTNFLANSTVTKYSNNINLRYKIDILDYRGSDFEIKYWLVDEYGTKLEIPSKLYNQELNIAKPNPGNYSLVVQVTDKVNNWTSIKKHSISILPLWWQHLWLQIVSLLCLLLLLSYGSYKIAKSTEQKRYLNLLNKNNLLQLKNNLLLSRLKPHFIFNAFNPLQYLILKNKTMEALQYLEQLSLMMRSSITIFDKKYISLSREIIFIQQYIYIQKTRFAGSLLFNIITPQNTNLDVIIIPPMLLQPIIENAIEHSSTKIPDKIKSIELTISFDEIKKTLLVDIQDNGTGFPENFEPATGRGMGLIVERISLIFNEMGIGSISFENNETGANCHLVLPLLFNQILDNKK